MPRNKPRLQLALYARPKHPDAPHYALFIASKVSPGTPTKHHAKNTLLVDENGNASSPWRYERTVITEIDAEQRLLVRVNVAKLAKPRDEVDQILESLPVYQVGDRAAAFNCVTWVRDAYRELARRGAISGKAEEWEVVERKALEYVQREREQGRWSAEWKGSSVVPLMDLIHEKKVVE